MKGGLGRAAGGVREGHPLACCRDRRKGTSGLPGVKDEVRRGRLAAPACVLHAGDKHLAGVLEMRP